MSNLENLVPKQSRRAMWNEMISTPRLKLVPLTPGQLAMYLDRDHDFNNLVAPSSREILTDDLRRAISMKLERMEVNPEEDLLWITYWLIVVLPDDFGAGMIGYKGAPDENGQVEIGYGIDREFQNRGYMTEAVKGMINWAFSDSRCTRIVAPDTLRANIGSTRVLKKVGMIVYESKPESQSWSLDRDLGAI